VTDYYAVLQVHPDAVPEVIDAAYRQLMRKYHPDVAGTDASLATALHDRAKVINQAYAVLRDPAQRRAYDAERRRAHRPTDSADPGDAPDDVAIEPVPDNPSPGWAPLRTLAAGYYLLPGLYEWEDGHGQEVLATLLVLPLGIVSWTLASGRLDPFLAAYPFGLLAAWVVVFLCALPAGRQIPRLVMASGPTLLQLSGNLDGPLRSAHLSTWIATAMLALVSLLLSARLYVFGVLPTLGVCWLLSQFV
jgi:DnaJ domain